MLCKNVVFISLPFVISVFFRAPGTFCRTHCGRAYFRYKVPFALQVFFCLCFPPFPCQPLCKKKALSLSLCRSSFRFLSCFPGSIRRTSLGAEAFFVSKSALQVVFCICSQRFSCQPLCRKSVVFSDSVSALAASGRSSQNPLSCKRAYQKPGG